MTMTAEQLAQTIRPDLEMLCDSEELTAERRAALARIVEHLTPPNLLALLDELERKDKQATQDVQIKARLCRESNSLHDRLREADKRIAELEEQLRREQDYHLSVDLERMELWKKLEARTVTVKLPTAYDLTGETDGNCSLNDASMQPDIDGCYFRRRDVESACAAAGINLTVEG